MGFIKKSIIFSLILIAFNSFAQEQEQAPSFKDKIFVGGGFGAWEPQIQRSTSKFREPCRSRWTVEPQWGPVHGARSSEAIYSTVGFISKRGTPSSLIHDPHSALTFGMDQDSMGGLSEEHVRITTDGKVGIGTTNPSNLLTVAGRMALSRGDTVDTIHLEPNSSGSAVAILRRADGTQTVKIDADDGDDAAKLTLYDGSSERIELDADGAAGGAEVVLKNEDSINTVVIDGADGTGAGYIEMRPGLGSTTLGLYSNLGGKSRVVTDVLEITGGSDLSEQFEVTSQNDELEPGSVLCIDPSHPGALKVSQEAYDPKVAGILSGAGGVDPGMLMKQSGSVADGAHPVALTGRVYCLAETSNGAIEVGDLLTTSDRPGHAMKATDHERSQGAILGKAMTPLEGGRGLVLVLVSLQ